MTYKQIETLKEIRLWLSQIIVPAASVVVAMTVPEVRQTIGAVAENVKYTIKSKIKK